MTGLRDALQELAEEAPRADLTGRVIAGARRRRRVRVLAAGAGTAAVTVAATVIAGSLNGAGTESAPPVTASAKDYLNSADPGPLPSGKVETVKYAYLDWCKRPVEANTAPPTGDCTQWRIVGRSGKQWRVADALGVYSFRTGTGFNTSAPLKISDDGRQIVYYRQPAERFVVRDLISGRETVIGRRVPMTDFRDAAAELMFSGDGRRVAISWNTERPLPGLLADTATGQVRTLPGNWVVGLGADASTVTLAETKKNGRTTLLLTGPDGKLRDRVPLDPQVHQAGPGNMVGPDGHTMITLPGTEKALPGPGPAISLTLVKLVDVRTGKVTGSRKVRLPKNLVWPANVTGWAGPSAFLLTVPVRGAPDRSADQKLFTMGDRGFLIDLNTGRAKPFGTIKLLATQAETSFGGFTHQGG